MRGQMMDRPLLISQLIDFAATYHGDAEIVTRTTEGPIHRYGYAEARGRAAQLAHALGGLGIEPGDRVATLAWNNYRHFELYYAISGIGAVCHTINPRLFRDQLVYIVNHAQDRYIFVDLTFVPLLESLQDDCPDVAGFVVMTDRAHMPESALPNAICYEELIAGERADIDWPVFDETTASSLCYTSGTTGNPKGALYSHRSTLLHTFMTTGRDGFSVSGGEVVLPAVPMFHVNAWGIPYGTAMVGATLVLPGPGYDGAQMYEMLDRERVTVTAGVPTIWLMLLDYLKTEGKTLPYLKQAAIGGSAVPLAMMETFEEDYGVDVYHGWGMTEMSPVGSNGTLKAKWRDETAAEKRDRKTKQGGGLFGVDWKIVDDDGNALPWDGETFGELLVRGATVIDGYYNDADASAASFDGEGWFATGDVATIDADGRMQIVDRAKDVIKSGGEWISSIDLENAAIGHPDVAEAAVIGVAHPKWDERPLLVVVAAGSSAPTRDALCAWLGDKVAKWWLPDDVVVVDELPHTATGKVSKLVLRRQLKDYRLPEAAE